MPVGVNKKGQKLVSFKKDRLLRLARSLSSTMRTLGQIAKLRSDWGRFPSLPFSDHVGSSIDERHEKERGKEEMGKLREVRGSGSKVWGEEPLYLTVLCSDESKMEIDAARPFLDYCFGQAGVVKVIFEELLRWFRPHELPAIIEALCDVFVVQGYDYPKLCGNTWTIGGPSWRLSASWCSTRRRICRQGRNQDALRYLFHLGDKNLARKIMYLHDDVFVADAFCTECAGLICQAG